MTMASVTERMIKRTTEVAIKVIVILMTYNLNITKKKQTLT